MPTERSAAYRYEIQESYPTVALLLSLPGATHGELG
jgi:hypothetical protein